MAKEKSVLSIEEKLQKALVSECEQPYKVPSNWCWTRLREVLEVNPKSKIDDNIETSFIPMAYIEGGLKSIYKYDIRKWKDIKKGFTHFQDNDVIFAKISPCFENRKSVILENLENSFGAGTTELIVLRQKKINKLYIFWLVNTESFIKGGVSTFSGTVGQQRVSMNYVRDYPFPLPPLAEQKRIVERVESMFSKLDEAKSIVLSALDTFENRKAAILHKAFTGELTANWRKEHGENNAYHGFIHNILHTLNSKDFKNIKTGLDSTKVHTISSWLNLTIGAIGIVSNGSTPSRKQTEYWNGEIPWVSSGEVRNNIINCTREHITDSGLKNSSVRKLKEGTVLIAMIGEGKTRGQSSILNTVATINQNIAAIEPFNEICDSKFLWYWFQKTYKENRTKGNGSGPQALNCQRVRELEFVLPSLLEQKEIVRILDNIFEKEEKAKELCSVVEHIDIMKKAILAKAFRGELGTNRPDEESSVELLRELVGF